MKTNSIILENELKFREYIIYNPEEILKIFIFEDTLDNSVFFYCFTKDKIIATKEKVMKPFSYYKKLYSILSSKMDLKIDNHGKDKILKLINKKI